MQEKTICFRVDEETYTTLKKEALKKTGGNISRLIKLYIKENDLTSPLENAKTEILKTYRSVYEKILPELLTQIKNGKAEAKLYLNTLQMTTKKFIDAINKYV